MSNSKLGSFIIRIQRLEDEKAGLVADIREVYKEAKEAGFDPKIMRKVVARQKKTEHELREEQRLIEECEASLGMLADTPLGQAAHPGHVHA